MGLLFWIAVVFIIIGFLILVFIKRHIENKKNLTTQSMVWWIVGTGVGGVMSIILIVWLLNKLNE